MEEMCGMVGRGSCMEEGQGDGGDDKAAEFNGVLQKHFVHMSQ
jgi:hypothetical protein